MIKGKWHKEGVTPDGVADLWASVFGERRGVGAIERCACLYSDDGKLAAAGVLAYDGAFTISRVAVREEFRRQGYGDLLTRMMIDAALQHGAGEIRVKPAHGFFERYGFTRDGDDMVIDAKRVRLTCS